MNVLLIEDEVRVADFIRRGLSAEGWSVAAAPDGETGLRLVDEAGFDVVILDRMLPGISGQEVCRRLRARRNRVPILMLSALDAVEDRIEGLQSGADDYLVKPFHFEELLARLGALRRRSADWSGDGVEDILRTGEIVLDRRSLVVTVGGRPVDFSVKERELLQFLMAARGRVLSRERILNAVWGLNEDPLTNVVDVYVARLRRKLGTEGDRIVTLRNVGYRMD